MLFQNRYENDGQIKFKYVYSRFNKREKWTLDSIWYRYDNTEKWRFRQ
jgi:hypothetical protein